MVIIGCDFHPSFQQVAIFDKQTGEIEEKCLLHRQEAEQFYRETAEVQTRTLGAEHPHTLTSLSNLAAVLQEQGQFAEARPGC